MDNPVFKETATRGTVAFLLAIVNVGKSICMAYGAENVQEQNARCQRLECLYHADLRHLPEHPFHGFYCGLHQLYRHHREYGESAST